MSKKSRSQSGIRNNDKEELDVNGNPIDPNKEYIGNKIKVPMLSPDASIYKRSTIIILKGKGITEKQKKKTELLEFLSRAPISFSNNED